MKPIDLPGRNVIIAEDQPQYLPLPAIVLPEGEIITCWELSEEEIIQIVRSKKFYLLQSTFNSPMQPILPAVNLEDFFTTL